MAKLNIPFSDQESQKPAHSLTDLFQRRPLFSVLMIFLVDLILSLLLTQLFKRILPAGPQTDFYTLIALFLLTAGFLTALGWWREVGFNSPTHWRRLGLVIIPLLAVIGLPLVGGIAPVAISTTLYYVVGYALTAFHEEVIFRGLFLRILGPTGRARAIWISSLLFGLAHIANMFVRSNPFLVFAQMIGAGTGGVGMAGLRFGTNTIWLVLAIHFLEDFLLHYTRLPVVPVNVVQSVILFGVGLYILWKYRRDEKFAEG